MSCGHITEEGSRTEMSDSHFINRVIAKEVIIQFFYRLVYNKKGRAKIPTWNAVQTIINIATAIVSIDRSGVGLPDAANARKLERGIRVNHLEGGKSVFAFGMDNAITTWSMAPSDCYALYCKLFKDSANGCVTPDMVDAELDDSFHGVTLEELDAMFGDEYAAFVMSLETA
eukprot:gene19676-26361_t